LSGSSDYERFGASIDIDDNTLLIGNNPSTLQSGRAEFFKRSSVSYTDSDSPLVSGPLYNTHWTLASDLSDSMGVVGDHFGFSVAFYGDQAVVGAIMPDLQADGSFGQGVVYVYDRVSVTYVASVAPSLAPTESPTLSPTPASGSPTRSPTRSPTVYVNAGSTVSETVTNTNSAMGISFWSFSSIISVFILLSCAFAIYKHNGGESSARQLLCFESSSQPPAPKQIRVATMDDSGISALSSNRGHGDGDPSSSHTSVPVHRMPARPTSAPPAGGEQDNLSGATRSFTPPAHRVFKPPARQNNL
jgi:hypothetical protein